MDASDALALLLRAGLGATVAVLLIALLRHLLRRAFGPSVAFWAWTLLPALVLVAAIGRQSTLPLLPMGVPIGLGVMPMSGAEIPTSASGLPVDALALGAWLLGMGLFAAWRVRSQRRWRKALGAFRIDHAGLAWAKADASLPALVGWPRARVVLPEDFTQRFAPGEHELVIAHERRHLRRGDLHSLLLFEGLRALLWFNPLLHWAASAFRHDQELACDAEVLAAYPRRAADYARALLRATALPMPPIATAWGFSHPLKERLAMLQAPAVSSRARTLGALCVALLLAGASLAVWASSPRMGDVPDGKLRQTWVFQIDGGPKLGPFLLVEEPGVPVEIRFEHEGQQWTLVSSAQALPEARFDVKARVLRGGVLLGEPRMVIDAKGGQVAIGEQVMLKDDGGQPVVLGGFSASVHVEAGDGLGAAITVPSYPEAAVTDGLEGRVMLRVSVDRDGRATEVQIEESSGHAALDAAAISSARDWRFNPSVRDGQPVSGEVLVPVDFRAESERSDGA